MKKVFLAAPFKSLVNSKTMSMDEEKKNETAFLDEPRNLCMDISKVQNYGISFCDSYEGFEKALSEFDG